MIRRLRLRLYANPHAKPVRKRHSDAGSGPAISKNRRTRALRSKGDEEPPDYMPPNQDQWCAYASGWISVKTTYQLTITSREHDGLTRMLATCR
jgi:hypothetical protein